MFNRTNKLVAGLVAAASMMGTVTPVMAAERLATIDGNITSAIAFDGGYVFDGYKTDDDDTALYYNNGSEDVEVEDYDDYDYSDMVKYGEKFAIITDDGEEYLLDLSKGKILDDESLDDQKDNIASKLRTNLKKTDRYGKITDLDSDNLELVLEGKFGEVWYMYTAAPLSTADGISDAIDGNLYGLTNESGKYIDLCKVANITVVKENGKSVKVSEFNDEKDGVTVTLSEKPEVVAQDADNFYVLVKVDITGGKAANATYIQKVSKAQGEKVDDAYVPKNVSSYEVANGIYDDSDIDDAATLIESANAITVKGSNLLVTTVDNKNVKVSVIKLKKEKPELVDDGTKVDVYVATLDTDDDQDIIDNSAYAIDVEGNTWALDKGQIYKFDGSEFKQVYTCDRSINSLDVYNENNLIAWDSTGDVFTAISNGAKVEEETTTEDKEEETTTTAKVGWDKNENGTWSYYDEAGNMVKASWVNVGGVWYYLNADGVMATGWLNDRGTWYYLNASGAMQTGWLNDNGTWYYLNASGAMQTGWLNDNGTWYYLNASGAMLSNTTVDGYVLGANGAWIK